MANYQIICNAQTINGSFCKQKLDDFLVCRFHQKRHFNFIKIKYTCNQVCKDSHLCKSKVASESSVCNFHSNTDITPPIEIPVWQNIQHIHSKNKSNFKSKLLNNFLFISLGFLFYYFCVWYIQNKMVLKEQFYQDSTNLKNVFTGVIFPFFQKHLEFFSKQFLDYRFFYQTLIYNYFLIIKNEFITRSFIMEKLISQILRYVSCNLFSVYIFALDFCYVPVQKNYFFMIKHFLVKQLPFQSMF